MFRLSVLCVLVAYTLAAEECYPMGVSGELCGGRYCPEEEGVCVDDKCECTTRRGQPELLCSNDEDYFASCVNDPKAWTMNNREEAEVPVPCMYQFSHVATKLDGVISPNGRCNVQVNLHNQRVRGKMYVGGFEVRVKCRNMNSLVGDQNNVYKADAYVNENGEYCFNLQVSSDGGVRFHDNLQGVSNKIDFAPYTFKVEPTTNRVKLQIPVVGVTAQLRPYDPQYSVFDQKWLPGFAVKYDVDKEPVFKSEETVVSLVPGATLNQASGPFRTGTDELIFRAFTGPGNRNRDFPNYTSKCRHVKMALQECPDKASTTNAMDTCRFILASPNFVNCYSDPGTGEVVRMLSLYERCVETFCKKDADMCMAIKLDLQNLPSKCKVHTPDEMLEHSCMFNVS